MINPKPANRHKARKYALQAIYQWEFTKASPTQIDLEFRANNDMSKTDVDYFSELLHGVIKHSTQIDTQIAEVLDRPIHDLNPVELAVLRISVYELLYRLDVPYKVIINEALRITKAFGSSEGFKYVNGVLDTLARKVRSLEVSLQPNKGKENIA